MRALVILFICVVSIGCKQADPRFASPAATVHTLFSAYGIADMSEEEVRSRLQARERFDLREHETHRACFADWNGEQDQGLAGYVFGRLAAAKDHLRIETEGDMASVTPEVQATPQEPIVLHKADGVWKITLRQSVPEEVRSQLYQLYRRARDRERKAGL